MSRDWRLTEQEKWDLAAELLSDLMPLHHKLIIATETGAKAQAKRLVEWGYGLCTEHNNGRPWRFLCCDCREQLRKDVGLS